MSEQLSPTELFERVWDLYPTRTTGALLELVERQWEKSARLPATPPDAETCRLAMLAQLSIEPLNLARAQLWRARALARFAALGWSEGIAAVMMGEAFQALAIANNNYPQGKTLDVIKPSPEAEAILRELAPFATEPGTGISVGPSSPTPALIARFMHEKGGFLQLVARRFDEARESYRLAFEAAGESRRGQLKVTAGLALVDYLADLAVGGQGSEATAVTEQMIEGAKAARQADLVDDGRWNLAVMRQGGQGLKPYEIL